MDLVTGNTLLHGFQPTPHRTIRGTSHLLHVVRSWGAESLPSSDPVPPELRVRVCGRLELDQDSIRVMGHQQPPTKLLSLSILPYDGWETLAWHKHVKDWGDPLDDAVRRLSKGVEDEDRLAQYLRNVYREFETRPPTLFLHFRKAEWEIGNEDEWGLQIEIPRVVFNALVADVREKKCSQLTLGFKLAPPLSGDEHAPPSGSVTFGVLAMLESSWGWVDYTSWDSDGSLTPPVASGSLPSADEPYTDLTRGTSDGNDSVARRSLGELREGVRSLATATRIGFLLVLVLIVLLALLR